MKASSESGEWASLISTVCSPDFRVAVRADMEVELPFAPAVADERDAFPQDAKPVQEEEDECDAGNLRGAVPGLFLCGKKGSTGEMQRPAAVSCGW